MKLLRERIGLIHEVENMHAHDAVERVRGDIVRLGEVRDDGRVRILLAQIEYVDPRRPSFAVPADIPRIVEFQAAAPDLARVGLEESLHIVSVNGQSALVSEGSAHGLDASGEEQTPSGHAKSSV